MKSPLNFCPRRRWNLSASLPRLGTTSLWYFERNYDAGVPPASFFEDGSQGPPCDPNLSQPLGKHRSFTSREASAAGRLRSSPARGSCESRTPNLTGQHSRHSLVDASPSDFTRRVLTP